MAGKCIVDDNVCREASCQEIIRRYYQTLCDKLMGRGDSDAVYKVELLMSKAGVTVDDRKVVKAANDRAEETENPAAVLLNALKKLGNIDDEKLLISPCIIEPIQNLKTTNLGNHNPRLHTDEVLIALCMSAVTDETAALAMEQLPKLKGCEAHSSVMLSQVDSSVFRKLGLNLTCEPKYQTKKLYHK